jgi:hypothetical protein
VTVEQRDYRSRATKPGDAVEEAKATARGDEVRVKTVARIRGVPGRYIVTLAVEPVG